MTDLYIDGPMLERVKSNFGRIEDLLRGPASAMKELDADQVGPPALESRMNEFGEEWDYGFDQLSEFTGSVVDALGRIAEAFEKADADLAAALRDAG